MSDDAELRFTYSASLTVTALWEVFDNESSYFIAECPNEDFAKLVTDALNFKHYGTATP